MCEISLPNSEETIRWIRYFSFSPFFLSFFSFFLYLFSPNSPNLNNRKQMQLCWKRALSHFRMLSSTISNFHQTLSPSHRIMHTSVPPPDIIHQQRFSFPFLFPFFRFTSCCTTWYSSRLEDHLCSSMFEHQHSPSHSRGARRVQCWFFPFRCFFEGGREAGCLDFAYAVCVRSRGNSAQEARRKYGSFRQSKIYKTRIV